MKRWKIKLTWPSVWPVICLGLVLLGVFFRLTQIGQPVYWVDEVATSMRVAGYTRAEVVQQIATGQPLRGVDLQQFQVLRDRDWSDTLQALIQSPEHSPLYFLLARGWAQRFGSSVVAMRSLSVGFSLLALPMMYHFCQRLFAARFSQIRKTGQISWTATALLAMSPFFVVYAKEARPYSLWALLLLLLCSFLWQALQADRLRYWLAYGLLLALSLYTSLLTVFVLLGQGLYVAVNQRSRLRPYLWATGGGLLAFSPWVWLMLTTWQRLEGNTTWAQEAIPLWAMAAIWLHNLAVLVFDLPVATQLPSLAVQMGMATVIVSFIGYALYRLWQVPAVGGFILALAGSTPGALIGLDLIRGGQISTAARYFIPGYLGLIVAIAYLLSPAWLRSTPLPQRRWWRLIAVGLIGLSLLSCLFQFSHSPRYQKSRNLSNPAIVTLVNQARSPLLIADADQVLDLISLSYQLQPDVTICVLASPDDLESVLARNVSQGQPVFLFNPSELFKQRAQAADLEPRPVFQPKKLISRELGLTLWRADGAEMVD